MQRWSRTAKNDCGKLILDDTEKAERLNNYFMSVFTADDVNLPDFGRRVDESVFINHVEFTSLDLINPHTLRALRLLTLRASIMRSSNV